MDDMTTFERQLADESLRIAGEPRPVDVRAVFEATTATQDPKSRFESMFSATKFVVAGAIVALFGGFLLAGLLTQPSEESVPAVGATTSADASQSTETAIDVRDLEWRPLELDDATFGRAHLVDVAASDTMLVIGGSIDGSAAIWTSTDGLEWTLIPQDEAVFGGPGRHEIKAVAPWRDGFVAGGEVRGSGDFDPLTVAAVWLSEDGNNWTRVPHDEAVFGGAGRQEVFDIATTDDRIVIVGFDEAGSGGSGFTAWTSSDGRVWKQTAAPGYWSSISTVPEGFVAVGSGIRRSNDGVTWELSAPLEGDVELESIASTPDALVALGGLDGDLAAWSSSDGVDWTQSTIDAPVPEPDREAEWQPSEVAASASGFAAVVGPWDPGDESAVIVSSDGKIWLAGRAPDNIADAGLAAITGFGSDFVALGGRTDDTTIDRPVIWTTIQAAPSAPSEPDDPSDETAAVPDLLPGVDLVTREVEPGVYQVVSDGVRELRVETGRADSPEPYVNLVAGFDGSIWILDRDRFYRLGDADTYPSVPQTRLYAFNAPRPYVDADGTLWVMAGPWWEVPRAERGLLYSFADGEWQTRHESVQRFAMQADGTVWAIRDFDRERDDDYSTLERLDPDGWTVFDGLGLEPETIGFWVGPGTQTSVDQDDAPEPVADIVVKSLNAATGTTSVRGNTPLSDAVVPGSGRWGSEVLYLDIGAGGDAWAYMEADVPVTGAGEYAAEVVPYLIQGRIETGVTATYGPEHGVPMAADESGPAILRTGPDGRLWMIPRGTGDSCDGIASFDGTDWARYLRGACVRAFDFSPDGSAWVRTATWPEEEVRTYVITLEPTEPEPIP